LKGFQEILYGTFINKTYYYLIMKSKKEKGEWEKMALKTLRDRGCRITPQRIALLKNIVENPRHPTCEELYVSLKKDMPSTSRSTVYNTIALLEETCLLRTFEQDGMKHIEANASPHANLVCVRCGKTEDIESMLIDRLVADIKYKTHYFLLFHNIEIFGVCSACHRKAYK